MKVEKGCFSLTQSIITLYLACKQHAMYVNTRKRGPRYPFLLRTIGYMIAHISGNSFEARGTLHFFKYSHHCRLNNIILFFIWVYVSVLWSCYILWRKCACLLFLSFLGYFFLFAFIPQRYLLLLLLCAPFSSFVICLLAIAMSIKDISEHAALVHKRPNKFSLSSNNPLGFFSRKCDKIKSNVWKNNVVPYAYFIP